MYMVLHLSVCLRGWFALLHSRNTSGSVYVRTSLETPNHFIPPSAIVVANLWLVVDENNGPVISWPVPTYITFMSEGV
jgi:hypothetical protein